ncbi:glutamate--tRNA ligase [Flavobacterium piscinae]|uniref:Glutamate--tRNA ligase n=1 Tax=Flavobacterium piscinae TaxID=2506424 RepID=A0A4Q1KTX9_9FLAO|nr:glutamate--tRNA ligase [Flavobacterium piscinae]RXR33651.1 glutamate--tRNA ligase [Flavobacterium piscinae]
MSRPVRVRFAPSPTGPLHIGGVRTALFNYLFAKKNNGVFYLRIEDTDQNRFVPGAEQYIFEALEWLGISPSETVGKNEKFGPYRQSERKHLYKQYADQLIQSGWAYYAFDTPEALDKHRKQHEEQGKTFIYNWHNREKLDTSLVISDEETNRRIAAGEDFVIRFKTPVNEVLELKDIIRGDIKFDTNLLDDKVLFKSDGMPTYHLANIVDDHLMETSHVIRGEEWLPSLPLHHLLYKAFGWEAPEFAHLPLILKPIGNGKLSKRDGDKMGFPVFPLEWKTEEGISSGYRETGYFPEAVINFLALLGWNDGTDQELFSLDELVEKFDLNRVHKAGAKFDPEKNKWFNHQYLQKQSEEALAELFISDLKKRDFSFVEMTNRSLMKRIVSSIKERANFVSDFWELADYFFVVPTSYDEKASKNWKEETPVLMKQVIDVLVSIDDFTSLNIETIVKDWMTTNEIGMGKVMQPLRLSLVGALKGPHLFDIIELIGKEETVKRIEKAIQSL